ncbi:hypothetical protein ACWENR_10130 [Micromonospora sp. NPDC004336]
MRWLRRVSLLAATTGILVFGVAAQANAAVDPQNVGWLYTVGKGGAAFFDADLSGYPSQEKLTVCDNSSNGRGVRATFSGTTIINGTEYVQTWDVIDPSNNGVCGTSTGNIFSDGHYVYVEVCEYAGDWVGNCARARGVA